MDNKYICIMYINITKNVCTGQKTRIKEPS